MKHNSTNWWPFSVLTAALASCGGGSTAPDASLVSDAAVDGAQADAAPVPECNAGAYQGDASWPASLVVSQGSLLCAHPRDFVWDGNGTIEAAANQAMAKALSRKGLLIPVAGTYKIPDTSTAKPFLIPACIKDGAAAPQPLTAANAVEVVRTDGGIGAAEGYFATAEFGIGAEKIQTTIVRRLDQSTATVSPAPLDLHTGTLSYGQSDRIFVGCELKANRCWDLKVGNATIQVDEHYWQSSPGLGFAYLTRISGSVNGLSLSSSDYANKTTIYGHHAFDRYHFVKLAAPQGNICGVRIDLNVQEEWKISSASCDGATIASLGTVTAVSRDCQ